MKFFSETESQQVNKKPQLKSKASNTFLEDDNGGAPPTTTGANVVVLEEVILKIPEITIIYWCEKMTATTFGGKKTHKAGRKKWSSSPPT